MEEPMTLLLPAWLRETFNLARAIAGERRWSWTEGYRLLRCFEMRSQERAFVKTMLTRRTNVWLFRCNQRLACGDFIAVDMSPPSPADRRATVMELKTGAPLVIGGAHLQYARHRAALDEIVATGVLAPTSAVELVHGDDLAVLASAIAAAGGVAAAVAGDVREEELARALVATAVERFSGLDVAFNNAGTLGELGPTHEISPSSWRDTIETNLTGAFLGARHQVPAMLRRGGGSIIFTSSFVGHTAGVPGTAAYAASKAGLIALTMTMAAELGPQRIRVNALLPGGTDTPAYRIMASTPEAESAIAAHHALRRVARPDEIARSALYLASDASSFTTGSALLADGGVSMYWT